MFAAQRRPLHRFFYFCMLVILLAGNGARADELTTAALPESFDPAKWPGLISKEEGQRLPSLKKELAQAMNKKDGARIQAIVADMRKVLGRFAGCPEVKPEYGAPIDASEVNLAQGEVLCRKVFERMKGHTGWEVSQKALLMEACSSA